MEEVKRLSECKKIEASMTRFEDISFPIRLLEDCKAGTIIEVSIHNGRFSYEIREPKGIIKDE